MINLADTRDLRIMFRVSQSVRVHFFLEIGALMPYEQTIFLDAPGLGRNPREALDPMIRLADTGSTIRLMIPSFARLKEQGDSHKIVNETPVVAWEVWKLSDQSVITIRQSPSADTWIYLGINDNSLIESWAGDFEKAIGALDPARRTIAMFGRRQASDE